MNGEHKYDLKSSKRLMRKNDREKLTHQKLHFTQIIQTCHICMTAQSTVLYLQIYKDVPLIVLLPDGTVATDQNALTLSEQEWLFRSL